MSDTQATDVETPTDVTQQPTSESNAVAPEAVAEQAAPVLEDDLGPQPADSKSDDAEPEEFEPEDVEADGVDDVDGVEGADGAAPGSAKGEKKSRVRQLEREGEVAADFLETLLDIADLDGDIDVDVDGDRAAIAIVDSDEGRVPRRLVGTDGKVLEALQELTRLAVQVETGERSRLMLDIAGHRAQRRSALVELAKSAIAEVKESGTKQALEPMTAFERKVVHDEVAAAGLVSESEGVDPHRHVVILPA
ncbi:protein jag [Terrabacter sp. GCM10028922]|uniref:Jag family protein n=1 Tax=Terrabacter sp. GCM10028922 TaxID=3273428 RepID=UPI003613192A